MTNAAGVAIVGAGPYGLSVSAHLSGRGIEHRVFGSPMLTWREHMPNGMILKSDGFASNLSDPKAEFTLERFCAERGTPYDHTRVPVQLDTFREYGLAFQQQAVRHLEDRQVILIEGRPFDYRLHLDDGQEVAARNVVLAVGITHFRHVPPTLERLGADLSSHSSAHKFPERLRGRNVVVIGGGASAIDLAVLLKEAGADVSIVARQSQLTIHDPPGPNPRTAWQQLRRPSSPIGPGWRSRIISETPGLFRRLPEEFRLRVVKTYLGPSAGWPMKSRFEGKISTHLGYGIDQAVEKSDGIHLQLSGKNGSKELVTQHVVAATGYKVDLRRLKFLSPEILGQVKAVEHTPVLSGDLQSSSRGLYFVGVAAANSFGPMMRFACGAEWTAGRLSRALIEK
jgi:putative flavoprotein involved in K+ transport